MYNDILKDYLHIFTIIYLESDILMYSKTKDEHDVHVKYRNDRLFTPMFSVTFQYRNDRKYISDIERCS